MSSERRQFPRLELSEHAYAVDAGGRELGKVSQASGGGMLIRAKDAAAVAGLQPGDHFQVRIMEPDSQTANTIDVVVRFVRPGELGVEFVTGA